MPATPTTQYYAKQLYSYLVEPGISNTNSQSDWLLVLGSNDLSVAAYAADLWHKGVAPRILFSGGFGRYTRSEFSEPEAILFAKHAIEHGVNKDAITLETRSSNTQENIERSLAIIHQDVSSPVHITLITKPVLCRRVEATFTKLSSLEYRMSCANNQSTICEIGFTQQLIHQMVGEIDRLKHYPSLGYCNNTLVPERISSIQKTLIAFGFTQQLLKTS